ncbi:MAG: FAD-binding protein [Lentisphaeria bacterium]|nr:FAD-binding protein [Lentisphaeria bacterium]NQZ71083.1 FAD-binding protein [Lentisphaeria bacterium]
MPFDSRIKQQLIDYLGKDWVKDDSVTLYSYSCDGLTLHPAEPMGVIFPDNTDELVAAVKLFAKNNITFLPRGAGTGLSGGAIPNQGSVVIEMNRMNRILDVDEVNRTITVEPGVVNLNISKHASPLGLHFVPDPSSQKACTIGGNVGENSGGPHTLKYGVTVNHILAMEVILPDGECIELGGNYFGTPGPDLLGLFIGSEGTFGIATKITCRLTANPERAITLLGSFSTIRDACQTVSDIIGNGIVPAALEMIDKLVISALEQTIKPGFPLDAEAILIIELEDLKDGLDEEASEIEAILKKNNASTIRRATDDAERALIWQARKGSFGAIGKLSPSYYTQDGVIPRSSLPDVLDKIMAIGDSYGLRIANVFHAGDGNLHPLILYNSLDEKESQAALDAGMEILQICLDTGGSLSGEHGIGLEKNNLMSKAFSEVDLDNMQQVRVAFNPHELLNPGKIFPTPGRCGEIKMLAKKSGIQV